MTSKLEVYNLALRHLGERKLASLAEAREPRRAIDDVWERGVRYCLEQGLWNFALRTVLLDASPSISPAFGYTHAFAKPGDWIRTAQVADNETLRPPLLDYSDEADLWYANCDPLYVQYVSDAVSYGFDLSRWTETFTEYVAVTLARRICKGITSSESVHDELMRLEKRARSDARAKDAMNQAVAFPPQGTWVRSRTGGRTHHNTDNR